MLLTLKMFVYVLLVQLFVISEWFSRFNLTCVNLTLRKGESVIMCQDLIRVCLWFFFPSQFSSSSESPHECLSRSLPLRVYVYDCKCLSGRKRMREKKRKRVGDERWHTARRQRKERERSRSVMVVAVYPVSYLACGLHNFPSRPPLSRPLSLKSATCSSGAFISTRRWPRKQHVSPKVA